MTWKTALVGYMRTYRPYRRVLSQIWKPSNHRNELFNELLMEYLVVGYTGYSLRRRKYGVCRRLTYTHEIGTVRL